jgi:hypothetical protein
MFAQTGALPAELEALLFDVIDQWPAKPSATKILAGWESAFEQRLSRPEIALTLLSENSRYMSDNSKRRFVALDEAVTRMLKARLGGVTSAIIDYVTALGLLGAARTDHLAFLFDDVRGGRGGKADVFDDRVYALATLAINDFGDARLRDDLFNMSRPVSGLNLSEWRGALPARSYGDHMIAARAALRYRHNPPELNHLLELLRLHRGNAQSRMVEALMVLETLREGSTEKKRHWIAALRALRAVESEPEIRADLGGLEVRLFDSITLEELHR